MGANELSVQLAEIARHRAQAGKQILAEMAVAGPMTFTQFLRVRARQWMAHQALMFQGRSMSYGALLDRIDRARHVLHERGVGAGQSVALLMDNSDHYVIWYLAVLGLGAVAVPLNYRLTAGEATYILEHSRAVLLLTQPRYEPLSVQMQRDHALTVPRIVLDPSDPESGLGMERHAAEPVLAADAPAALYYTSGTTGQPKGVVHSHASLIADALQSPSSWEYAFNGVRSLVVTPLFHIAAHTIFFPVLFLGGMLIVDAYSTERTFAQIAEHQVNAFFAVPSILLLMVEKARITGRTLPDVKTVMFGAAPMTISKLGEVQSLFPNAALVHGMGQTESGGTLVTLPGAAATARAGSVGLPMPGVEVAIVDQSDRPVPAGQVGELVARGPNLMTGYYRNEAATKLALANGWLHTGDLGYQDAEGLVTLVDRKKDMIIRGGENIYSCEVEQVLLRHSAIKAVAVVGQRDTIFGEQVAAFVVVDPESPRPSVDELAAHCRFSLADFKVPVTFRFADALPMTPTGKIRKAELRDALPAYERAHTR